MKYNYPKTLLLYFHTCVISYALVL
jgi:hypothetical protein